MLYKFNLATASILVLMGVLVLLPLSALRWNNLVLGVISAAPILTVFYLVTGGTIVYTLWRDHRFGHNHPDHRLSRVYGVIFAILAIVGFLSGRYWLGMFANSYPTAVLYTVFAGFFLYWGFFGDHEPKTPFGTPTDSLTSTGDSSPQQGENPTPVPATESPAPPQQPAIDQTTPIDAHPQV